MPSPRSRWVRFFDWEMAWMARLRWSVVGEDGMRALKGFNSWLFGGLWVKSKANRFSER